MADERRGIDMNRILEQVEKHILDALKSRLPEVGEDELEDGGAVFAKEENLSELNQGGYIKAISNYNRMGVGLVGTNNKFYTFHH